MANVRVREDIYTQDNKLEFIKNFDAAGDATITRVYNQGDGKLLAYSGELSEAQKKILDRVKK